MNERTLIYEKVYVETPVDTDCDGALDLIAVYVIRPDTTEQLPAVFVANPYMLSCNEDWYVTHPVDLPVQVYPEQAISREDSTWNVEDYVPPACIPRTPAGTVSCAPCEPPQELECISLLYQHLRERGYASVFSAGLGTVESQGITKTGSYEELLAFKAVIDWLNGRCRGFTNKTDCIEVKPIWCTGNVAMSAKSYLGTLAVGVATTGVEGLKTIIPEAAISNWYEYYHCNGLNLPAYEWQGDDIDLLAQYCFSRAKDPADFQQVEAVFRQSQEALRAGADRVSSNYNRFWDERNYLNRAGNIKASVLSIHGLNDWNVKSNQCTNLFQALETYQIPRTMILHQGAHIYVYNLKDGGVLDIVDRWLDYYLKGLDTGIEEEPKVLVQSNLDQSQWYASDSFPPKEMERVQFPIVATEAVSMIVDDLKGSAYGSQGERGWRDQLILRDEVANNVKFHWDLFQQSQAQAVRLSGTVDVSFEAAIDCETAVFSAMLVDVGLENRLTEEQVPQGEDFVFGTDQEPSPYKIITRGWLNAQNRNSSFSKESLEKERFYHYQFQMVATDYTIKKGHQLALIIYGIDPDYTQRSDVVTHIQIKNDSIVASIPLIQ